MASIVVPPKPAAAALATPPALHRLAEMG